MYIPAISFNFSESLRLVVYIEHFGTGSVIRYISCQYPQLPFNEGLRLVAYTSCSDEPFWYRLYVPVCTLLVPAVSITLSEGVSPVSRMN